MEELGYVSDEECHTRIDKGVSRNFYGSSVPAWVSVFLWCFQETVLQNRIFECFVQAVRVGVLEKATKVDRWLL